jgi:sulfur carrier protein
MMPIKVTVREIGKKGERKVQLTSPITIAELLEQLGYNRETVVIKLNGKIVVEEERISEGDSIEILPIVTGG